ncbi:MAG TPA: class I SAM-dependent methyltransferase [Solirubrobacterales bacterium]
MEAPDLTGFARALLDVEGEPERVLEIGCGAGDATLFLAREYPRARVRGLDASEDAVRAATDRVGLDPEGRVAFKVGEPASLPFPADHFDLVVQRNGRLDPAELARVSRPGGLLIVSGTPRARGPLGTSRDARKPLQGQGFVAAGPGAESGDGEFLLMRLATAEADAPRN